MAAKVISIEARKGGVGKTTLAWHVAAGIAKKCFPDVVLYMHIDPQGDAYRQFGVEPNGRCFSQLLLETAEPREVVMSINLEAEGSPDRSNLYYIPSSDNLTPAINQIQQDVGAMQELVGRMSDKERQRRGLETVDSLTDRFLNTVMPFKMSDGVKYIIIDCPPSLGPLQMGVHRFADWAVVPVRLGDADVTMTIEHTKQMAKDVEAGATMKLLSVVPNMTQMNLALHQALLHDLKKVYGRRGLLFEPIPLRTAIGQAQSIGGLTIWDYDPSSDVASIFDRLVEKVIRA